MGSLLITRIIFHNSNNKLQYIFFNLSVFISPNPLGIKNWQMKIERFLLLADIYIFNNKR